MQKQQKKKTHFFQTFISKIAKNNQVNITSNAKQQLNSSICILATIISKTAKTLTIISKKKTLSDREIKNSLKIILDGETLNIALQEGEESISKFREKTDVKLNRNAKSGLIFPPSISERFLGEFGYSKIMISQTAPIFLSSVLEYLTFEIIRLASENTIIDKRIRITIRDLELAIRLDEDLNKLFTKYNISFLGGGVVPYIHPYHLVKNTKKQVKKDISQKKHRFRPGTVAIREIKKQQKTSEYLTFAKLPFERLVREIVNSYNPMKISKNVFTVLQYFIEQNLVNILQDANFATIHAGRLKMIPIDIEFVNSVRSRTKNPYSLENKILT